MCSGELEFISKIESIYGCDVWSFDLLNYVNNNTLIQISCVKHNNIISVHPKTLLSGNKRCECCKLESRIESIKCNLLPDYVYDFDNYVDNNSLIDITCTIHNNEFKLSIRQHLLKLKGGCEYCIALSKNKSLIDKFNEIHLNVYDYSLIDLYNNFKVRYDSVEIICEKHGKFTKSIQSHLNGVGCEVCSNYNLYNNKSFVEKCNIVHDSLYSYPNIDYKNSTSKIEVLCSLHGTFTPTASNHMRGSGCPSCRLSKGELRVKRYLDSNDIEYIKEKRFDGCVYRYKLPFDFYLPMYDICVEYDGRQHYEPEKYYGGMDTFNVRLIKDELRNKFCKDNNIKLLRIPYWDFENIEEILNKGIK